MSSSLRRFIADDDEVEEVEDSEMYDESEGLLRASS